MVRRRHDNFSNPRFVIFARSRNGIIWFHAWNFERDRAGWKLLPHLLFRDIYCQFMLLSREATSSYIHQAWTGDREIHFLSVARSSSFTFWGSFFYYFLWFKQMWRTYFSRFLGTNLDYFGANAKTSNDFFLSHYNPEFVKVAYATFMTFADCEVWNNVHQLVSGTCFLTTLNGRRRP